VHLRFGLPAVLPAFVKKSIKVADKISAWLEATRIAGFSEPEADRLFGKPPVEVVRNLEIQLRPPAEVRADYVKHFNSLLNRMI
jgi:uncharacterized protein